MMTIGLVRIARGLKGNPRASLALALVATMTSGLAPEATSGQARGVYEVRLSIPLEASDAWRIDRFHHFLWSGEASSEAPLAEADGRLMLLDAGGGVVRSHLIARSTFCDECTGTCQETSFASAEFAYDARVARVELHSIDAAGRAVALKAARDRSSGPPSVRFLRPQTGDMVSDGSLIEWEAMDADGDALEFDLLYRPSVGLWKQLLLAFRTHDTSHIFERHDLPADRDASLVLTASDGFHTVETSVTGLRVLGNLPPRVHTDSPEDGAVYYEGSNIILWAWADDAEDGSLPVLWRSDRDGVIKDVNWTRASRGQHTLVASATDSAGITTEVVLKVFVRLPRFDDGPRLFLPHAGRP